MSEREDRIVYMCGCDGVIVPNVGDFLLRIPVCWDVGSGAHRAHCTECCQKIQAVNIDRLLRLEERMQHMPADMRAHNCDGSCADWDAECGGGCDE
jgi:hypothetical protein